RAGRAVDGVLVVGEADHVGRAVDLAPAPVELPEDRVVRENDANLAALAALELQHQTHQPVQGRPDSGGLTWSRGGSRHRPWRGGVDLRGTGCGRGRSRSAPE